MESYYSVPQLFSKLQKGELAKTVDLETSVKDHINLLIMSRIRDYRFDEEYGSIIWERDFESAVYTSTGEWCRSIETQLLEAIVKYEHRLVLDRNDVRVEDRRIENRTEKCIQITVKGILRDYGRPEFKLEFLMNVSPIITLEVK